MHAALCIPAVTGAWAHEGGGALHANSGIYKLDKTLIEGLDARDASVRRLDQSRIGAILTGEAEALKGGGPVKAMLIQNTNPMVVAPDQEKVRRGFARDDLFTCVHEQFLTDTARYADIVLPATMFLEHDDLYTGGGHQYLQFGAEGDRAAGGLPLQPRSDLRAGRSALGAEHPGFAMTPREIIDATLRASGRGTLAELEAARWLDCQPPFEEAHFLDGFAHPDGKFHFRADWPRVPYRTTACAAPGARCRPCPTIGRSTRRRRGASVQARDLAGAQFPQFELQRDRDLACPRDRGRRALMHPDDAAALGLSGGRRRAPRQRARLDSPARPAVEGAPRGAHRQRGPVGQPRLPRRRGINTLTGDDSVAPFGGAAFHDVRVWARAEGRRNGGGVNAVAEAATVDANPFRTRTAKALLRRLARHFRHGDATSSLAAGERCANFAKQ